MKVNDLIQLFLVDKEVYCAPDTIRFYRQSLSFFERWLSASGSAEAGAVTAETLKSYVLYLREQGVKATSIHTYFRSLNNFFSWAIDNGYIPYFKYKIKLPRNDPDIVLPLTDKEVKACCAAIGSCSVRPFRDLLIFRLMLDCGLRSSEVRHIRFEDVDMGKRLIVIANSKYNKSRVLPMPDVIQCLLQRYAASLGRSSGLLFMDSGQELSPNALKQFFQKLKKRSGVARVHAHLLRHTFATSYMMRHNNIEYLRIYMGHADYGVTQGYVHLASQCLLTRYDVYKIDSCFK